MELLEIELFICIKIDFALNNLQRLICHKKNKQSPENEVSIPLTKVLTAVYRLSIMWTSGYFDKIKRNSFPAVAASV